MRSSGPRRIHGAAAINLFFVRKTIAAAKARQAVFSKPWKKISPTFPRLGKTGGSRFQSLENVRRGERRAVRRVGRLATKGHRELKEKLCDLCVLSWLFHPSLVMRRPRESRARLRRTQRSSSTDFTDYTDSEKRRQEPHAEREDYFAIVDLSLRERLLLMPYQLSDRSLHHRGHRGLKEVRRAEDWPEPRKFIHRFHRLHRWRRRKDNDKNLTRSVRPTLP